ncbi:uncharacterized protein LOC120296051 [Eucalyptus grandis]|uniref:uncharacterized protein LOC120296051 n=1 Tax=Eucalyptus grandis TaxID=71139 RepID=UPI00192EE11E|nr:uncharacterized protein LOC120296051 [Eucalyptus grandis]
MAHGCFIRGDHDAAEDASAAARPDGGLAMWGSVASMRARRCGRRDSRGKGISTKLGEALYLSLISRNALKLAQEDLQQDPTNILLAELEKGHLTARQLKYRIISVLDRNENLVSEPNLVQETFVSHFKELFALRSLPPRPALEDLQRAIRCSLSKAQVASLAHPFSEMEIQDTLFSLARGKALGPDGYGVEFFKMDFQKAYDMVDWDFLEMVLRAFHFPDHFIRIIMGDPMSPYLFTLVMEVFSGILTFYAELLGFNFSWRCKATRLSHLFFVDDVFLFCRVDMAFVRLLKGELDTFLTWSGLIPNNSKSEVFLAGGSDELRTQIKDALGFVEGKLPMCYLGALIISLRLGKVDCVVLVNLITTRVQSWTHRFLSFAGRVQLIRSVLHAIQAYWASVFIIPVPVLDRIEQVLRQFL